MATKARLGIGSKLKLGNGASPEVFTAIAEELTLSFSGTKVPLIKVTNQDSPASSTGMTFEEYIPGIADGGSVDFTANFLPSNASQLAWQAALDGNSHNWQISLPNDPTTSPLTTFGHYSFLGFIVEDKKDLPVEKQMVLTGKVQLTGPVTWTAGS